MPDPLRTRTARGGISACVLLIASACAFAPEVRAQTPAPTPAREQASASPTPPPSPPAYSQLRYDEDWSGLRDPAGRTDLFDPLKYIPLGRDGWYLTLGGELRSRYERFRNDGWGTVPQDDGGYFLQRYLLHADFHTGSRVRTFIQLGGGVEADRAGGPRGVDEDYFDVRQAFVDVQLGSERGEGQAKAGSTSRGLRLRAGRQEMTFGSARLVATSEGTNIRRSFDGLRATVRLGGWQVDGFAVKPTEVNRGSFDDGAETGRTFWGVYGVHSFPLLPQGNADVYYFGLDRRRARFDQGAAREVRHIFGARLWGATGGWDYDNEFVYQAGAFGRGKISAGAASGDVGYTLASAPLRPRLGFRAEVASGDRDPANPDLNTYNAPFASEFYFINIGLLYPANLIAVEPLVTLKPTGQVTIATGSWFFWRQSLRDGIYTAGPTLARTGNLSRARYIGSQPFVRADWQADRHLSLTILLQHFAVGRFLRETPPGLPVDFFMASATYRF